MKIISRYILNIYICRLYIRFGFIIKEVVYDLINYNKIFFKNIKKKINGRGKLECKGSEKFYKRFLV